MVKRSRGAIKGVVQGVGFRPFIYQLARRYQLTGHVINTPQGVSLEVEGRNEDVELFFKSIETESPPLAYIYSVEKTDNLPLERDGAFEIRKSVAGTERSALIPADVTICRDCLAELKDPGDRRFRYPFINCTNCGPRYTIIKDVPYDRSHDDNAKIRHVPGLCRGVRRPRGPPVSRPAQRLLGMRPARLPA